MRCQFLQEYIPYQRVGFGYSEKDKRSFAIMEVKCAVFLKRYVRQTDAED